MSIKFQCPSCHASNEWPEYSAGKSVRCPKCKQRFVAVALPPTEAPAYFDPPGESLVDEAALAQSALQDSQLEDAAQKRREAAAKLDPEYSPAVYKSCDGRDMPWQRQLVFALMVRGLNEFKPDGIKTFIGIVFSPVILAIGAAIVMAAMGIVHLVCGMLIHFGMADAPMLLYVIPALILAFVIIDVRMSRKSPISVHRDPEGRVDRFFLGRLEHVFKISQPATALFFLGALAASHVGIVYFTPDHLGMIQDDSFFAIAGVTINEAIHGGLGKILGSPEWLPRATHTAWSERVFGAFRYAYDGLLLLTGYMFYRHFKMRRLFHNFPHHWRDSYQVAEWIDQALRVEDAWTREFLDEFLFLLVTAAYLTRDDRVVGQLTSQFRWIRVDAEVRRLFRNEDGNEVFAP